MFRISYDYSDARFLERFYDHTMKGGLAKDVKRGFALGFKDALRHCGVKFANRGFRILPANGDLSFPDDEVKAEKAVEKAVRKSVKDDERTRKEYEKISAKPFKHVFIARLVTADGKIATRKVSAYTFFGACVEAKKIVARFKKYAHFHNVVLAEGETEPSLLDANEEKVVEARMRVEDAKRKAANVKAVYDVKIITWDSEVVRTKVSSCSLQGAWDEARKIVLGNRSKYARVDDVKVADDENRRNADKAVDALCKLAKKAQKERKAEENRLRKIHGPNDVRLKCAKNDNFYIVRLQKWNGSKWRTDNDVAFMNVVDGLKWCRERGLFVREVVKPDGKVEVRL